MAMIDNDLTPRHIDWRDATRAIVALGDNDGHIVADVILAARREDRIERLLAAALALGSFLAGHVETESGRDFGLTLHDCASVLARMGKEDGVE